MARNRKRQRNWEDPLAFVVFIGLAAWASAARHDWRDMAILIGIDLIVFGGYLALGHPHRCKELTTRRGRCKNRAYGLLRGCRQYHQGGSTAADLRPA
jgi:hypothetical protein